MDRWQRVGAARHAIGRTRQTAWSEEGGSQEARCLACARHTYQYIKTPTASCVAQTGSLGGESRRN